jgi:hypothetical protein
MQLLTLKNFSVHLKIEFDHIFYVSFLQEFLEDKMSFLSKERLFDKRLLQLQFHGKNPAFDSCLGSRGER